jgi:hypothetical protein
MPTQVAGVAATNPAVITDDRSGWQDVASTAADREPIEVMFNLTRQSACSFGFASPDPATANALELFVFLLYRNQSSTRRTDPPDLDL